MGLDYPQSTDDSHAILAALKGQQIQRLEQDVQRQQAIIKALREQLAKAEARAEQAEYMLKAAGLSDINHYMTQLKELKTENERLTAALAQNAAANEWRNEAGQSVKERFDLP